MTAVEVIAEFVETATGSDADADAEQTLTRLIEQARTQPPPAELDTLRAALQPRRCADGVPVPGVQGVFAPDAASTLLCAAMAPREGDARALARSSRAAVCVALGAAEDRTLGDAATALAIGDRVGVALDHALDAWLRDRGWNPIGVAGRIAATASAARLLALDAVRTRHALGLAATGAGGLLRHAGGGVLLAARAAGDAVQAALLARGGFTSAPDALQGRRGLVPVMMPALDREVLGDIATTLATTPGDDTSGSATPVRELLS